MATTSAFNQYFEVLPALDPLATDAAFRIRHAVYCEDLHYEPPRPDGRERDEFDSHSQHCLLRHRPSSQFVGVTRLVLPPHDAPETLLPIERTCAQAFYREGINPANLPRHRLAEVSRLAVMRGFRRRRGEASSPLPLHEEDFVSTDHPRFPYIPIGLYLGAIAMARELGITHLLTLTEPRLARHFARFGVEVIQIGQPVEHRGLRVPSMIRVDEVIDHMNDLVRPMWREVEKSISHAMNGRYKLKRQLPHQQLPFVERMVGEKRA